MHSYYQKWTIKGVLEPSFQVVFGIASQNAIFYFFWAQIREKSVSNYP